ncbi:MAG: GDP-mannose 4,6-dehydratase [Acidimicrobiales bacterium]
MRAFITGGGGFVGHWLSTHLREQGDEVFSSDLEVDITDPLAVRAAIADVAPEAVYHLAAVSNVGESWDAPIKTFAVNAVGTLNVIEAVKALAAPPTVLLVCSSEVYGRVGADELPLTEDAPLRPVSPYAASKVSAEFLGLQAFLAHKLPVIRVRAFNHIGPGQAPSFVVASLARQIVDAIAAGEPAVRVGNLTPERDFTDVRDVVRAYRLLVERGVPGEVYNVCSGESVAIEALARRMLTLAGADLRLDVDPDRVRAVEMQVVRGDPSRLVGATGWAREYSLDRTLGDVLDSLRAG